MFAWLFGSAATHEERKKIHTRCGSRDSAAAVCLRANVTNLRTCDALVHDLLLCKSSVVCDPRLVAEYSKCTATVVNWTGHPKDTPSCAEPLARIRKCLDRKRV